MRRRRFDGAGITLVWLMLAAGPASGQAPDLSGKTILKLDILGLRFHREPAVKAKIESREGRRYDPAVVSADIHRLYETGFFAQIEQKAQPHLGGVALVFTVVENERVAEVELVGVKRQDAKVLHDALRLKSGEHYNAFSIKQDLEFLRKSYQQKGHHFVQVSASPPLPGPDGVTVRYTVVEGPEVTVRGVRFTGPVTVDPDVLMDQMRGTSPPGWFGAIFTSTAFVERLLREDLEHLKFYFRWEGWLDAEVTLEDLVFTPDKSQVTIVIHIDEHRPYRVRNLSVEGNGIFTSEEILQAMSLRPGGAFSEKELRASEDKILDKYRERAYILAEVHDDRVCADRSPEVDLYFQIREHGKVYLERLVIQGNDKTRDDVIRRALNVAPGEEYNKVALERGIRRLRDLGYFEPQHVTYREEPGSAPDTRVVILDVKEAPTGSIRFAGGFSTNFGVLGLINLTQRNFDLAKPPSSLGDLFTGSAFAGGGQQFEAEVMPGTRRSGFSVSFREPYVFGEPIGFSITGSRQVIQRIFGYLEDRRGVTLGFDRRFLDEHLKVGVRGRIENIKISQLASDATPDARAVEGLNILRSVTPNVTIDTRDSFLQPTEGGSATLATEFSGHGLGGDWNYTKTRLDLDYHIPVFETPRKFRHVLSVGGSVGWAIPNGTGIDMPLFERFFAGGGGGNYGLRGFNLRRVGPSVDGDPIGGDGIVLAQAEYSVPVYEDFLRLAAFVDTGDLEPTLHEVSLDQFRVATGFGIRFVIPQLGGRVPFAFYYGFPIRRLPGDERRSLFFDIGFPF